MFKIFHGTTFDGAQNIMKNGFDYLHGNAWSCSVPKQVYFYELNYIIEHEADGDEDVAINIAKEWANGNAQIQNALLKNPNKYTCVLELQFEDDGVYGDFYPDDSCDNTYGAVCIDQEIINNFIREGKCKIIPHYYPFCVKLSLIYLMSLVNNEYFAEAFENMNECERQALVSLSKSEYFFEDIFFCEEVEL